MVANCRLKSLEDFQAVICDHEIAEESNTAESAVVYDWPRFGLPLVVAVPKLKAPYHQVICGQRILLCRSVNCRSQVCCKQEKRRYDGALSSHVLQRT